MRNGHGRARGVGAPPRSRRSNEAISPRIPVPRIAYSGRDEKNTPDRVPEKKNDRTYRLDYICIHLYRAGRPGGLFSGYLQILLALVLEFDSHCCEILFYLQKCKKEWDQLTAENA